MFSSDLEEKNNWENRVSADSTEEEALKFSVY